MLVEGANVDDNLRRAGDYIRRAAESGCDIALLPECLDVGWTHPAARDLASPIPGKSFDALSLKAKTSGIFVVAGLVERVGDRLYNAAVLISPTGELLLKYQKINELSLTHDLYTCGSQLAAVDTSLGCVGINICADNFRQSLPLGHTLCRMGARIILSPSAWAVDADHDNVKDPYGQFWIDSYQELARLYSVPIIGVSNVGWINGGPWEGRKCIGNSIAVGADGEVAHISEYGVDAETLDIIELEISAAPAVGTDWIGLLESRGHSGL